jgi:hypothetical protein
MDTFTLENYDFSSKKDELVLINGYHRKHGKYKIVADLDVYQLRNTEIENNDSSNSENLITGFNGINIDKVSQDEISRIKELIYINIKQRS